MYVCKCVYACVHVSVCQYLCLPGKGGGVECPDASCPQHSDGLSVVIHHLEVQILVVLPPLHLPA